MELKVKNFYTKWTSLKRDLVQKDLDLFYKVVDIDGTVGRRMYPGCGREDNPRFYNHWFSSGRCHWNVILPLWMLNKRNLFGKYAVITNDLHSAIINTETYEIYDPTYATANKVDPKTTLKQFSSGYEIQNIVLIALEVDKRVVERFIEFPPESQRLSAIKIIEEHIESKNSYRK